MAPRNAIAVIGAGDAAEDVCATAREVGRAIARNGAALVCGGRGGVMEAAAEGARSAGGHTIGILPSYNRASANAHIEFAIATGMGEARNAIVVASADAVIALPGEAGTLSEIGLALKIGRPVVAIGAWHEIAGVRQAADAESAVALAFQLAGIALADENRND
ncbi:MAG TPA: TIGR00725 family protein [Candidatus Binataceae bacterium]|jgi:uncharacterized protein (TIGR00725 family)